MPLLGHEAFTNLALTLSALWERNVVETAQVSRLFNVQASRRASERTKGVTTLSEVPEYKGTLHYDDFDNLDTASYEHKHYARGMRVPIELIEDEEYGLIESMTMEHAMGFTRTVAKHMASVFNNAFSSSYPGPDGKALCATNHSTASQKQDFNNKGTTALTHDAVVSTRQLMRTWKDERSNVLMVNPAVLVVPVELEDKADEIVNSVLRSDNANNAINSTRQLSYVAEPLLTDANNWFMVDDALALQYLRWWWRVRPEFAEDPKSNYELELRMRGRMRYSFGWDTHTFIYGHEVS